MQCKITRALTPATAHKDDEAGRKTGFTTARTRAHHARIHYPPRRSQGGAKTAHAASTGECSSVLRDTGRHTLALLGVQVKPKLYSHLMAYGTIIDISISKARMLKSC